MTRTPNSGIKVKKKPFIAEGFTFFKIPDTSFPEQYVNSNPKPNDGKRRPT